MKKIATIFAETKKMATKAASVAAAATVMLPMGCVIERTGGGSDASLPVGTPMPVFAVSSPGYGTVTSGDLAGVRSAVVFFQTTCPDCTREMPGVEEAFRRVKGSGVRFVTISRETDASVKVPEYWAAAGMTMPYYFDPEGAVFEAFGVRYVPTLYLFGSDGKVAHAAIETFEFSADGLVKLIEDLK